MDGNILEPLNKDTLYEIAVLFKTILASIELGWTEKSIGLIGGSNPTASIITNGDIELRIFFQKLPRAFRNYLVHCLKTVNMANLCWNTDSVKNFEDQI